MTQQDTHHGQPYSSHLEEAKKQAEEHLKQSNKQQEEQREVVGRHNNSGQKDHKGAR